MIRIAPARKVDFDHNEVPGGQPDNLPVVEGNFVELSAGCAPGSRKVNDYRFAVFYRNGQQMIGVRFPFHARAPDN